MAFSMHSHSGQFCPGHAKDSLETIVQTAIARGFQTLALTEHMPRMEPEDLYPEELEAGHKISDLQPRHDAYIIEAVRLQALYAPQITLLIGFEADFIRPAYSTLIATLASHPAVSFFIGSIHHVHGIPIDYDAALFAAAVQAAGGTEEALFERYFDEQAEMLAAVRPRVVGHFDLIRLLSAGRDEPVGRWAGVGERVRRNLGMVVEMGALLEVNSAGLRKGLREPYPGRAICEEFIGLGGKFTLSDDSHGVDHVGTNYLRTLDYLEDLGVTDVYTFGKMGELKSVSVKHVRETFRPQE